MVPVTPTLAVPGQGWHGEASVSAGQVQPSGNDSSDTPYGGPSLSLQGGALLQSGLVPDFTWGGFASAQGRVLLSNIEIGSGQAVGTLTPGQRSTLSATSFDLVGDADLRIGLQAKFYVGTLTAYYHGVVQYETGPYFDYRRRIDGIGHYYNVSYDPLTVGAGPGADLSIGSAGKWSLGLTAEITDYRTQTQTYVETKDDVDVTKPGGSSQGTATFLVKPHLDIGNYSVFIDAAGEFFGTGQSFTLGMASRW